MYKQIRKILALSLCLLFLTGCTTQAEENVVYGVVSQNVKSTEQVCKLVTLNPETGAVVDTIFDFGKGGIYPNAALSPSGRYIAYNTWIERQDRELFLYDLKAQESKQLTTDSNGEIDRISWSDDNTIIATFTSHKRGSSGWHIFSYNTTDGTKTFLTEVNQQNNEPVYFNGVQALPNGGKLFFARGLESNYMRSWNDKKFSNALYQCDIDGTQAKAIFSLSDRTIGRISISPDHAFLAIEAFRYPIETGDLEPSDVYLYNLSTDEVVLLESGTSETLIEHWNLNWKNEKTLIYRSQDGWYSIDIATKQRNPLFSEKLDGENAILDLQFVQTAVNVPT